MRSAILFFLAAATAAGNVWAKTDFESAFDRILNYKCVAGYYINSTGAEEIAMEVSEKRIDLNDFLDTYYKTCEFGRAKRIAAGAKKERSSLDAFRSAFGFKCANGGMLSADPSEDIAMEVAAKKYEVKDLLDAFYPTCELSLAKRVATNAKKGRSSVAAFNRVLYQKCIDGSYVNAIGAEEVAVAVAAAQLNLEDFIDAHYNTCEFERAKRLAENAKLNKADMSAFNRARNYKCKDGKYLTNDAAEEVAGHVAAGSFRLEAFLHAFYSTCEFGRSVRAAKASKPSGDDGGRGGQSSSGSAL